MNRETFVEYVREALRLLYEPDRLRQSPLAELFGVANRLDTYSLLQNIIIEAIESLEPQADKPYRAQFWDVYEILFYRYLQQMTQQQVARQLGMSVRHLRRREHAAIEVLASQLWKQFELETKASQDKMDGLATTDELAWLKEFPPESPVNLQQVLSEVLQLSESLTAMYRVHLETSLDNDLPALPVHAVALSQTLLSLLSVAIHRSPGGKVQLSAQALAAEVKIRVQAQSSSEVLPWSDDDTASLDLAHRLTELCGGKLTVTGNGESFAAILVLPVLEQVPVLVIDDNADTLQLLQRYATDTRYRLICTRDPEQALRLAEECSPRVIVLDVMMPQMDGWRMLARLRQHPLTAHIPVIVCTILPQEEMALSLGASDFVRKPVTRQMFLAALERHVARGET